MSGVSCRSGGDYANFDYSAGVKIAQVAGMVRRLVRRIGKQANFRAAFCGDIVMDLIGAVGERDDDVHGLLGLLGATDQQAGSERDVENGFVLAGSGATGGEVLQLVVLWGGSLGRGLLAKGLANQDDRAMIQSGCQRNR